MYRTKNGEFLHLSLRTFTVPKTFWRISAKHMSCWRPYCAVGVTADAIYCCWLVSIISGILAVAGHPPSVVDVWDVPIVSAAVA